MSEKISLICPVEASPGLISRENNAGHHYIEHNYRKDRDYSKHKLIAGKCRKKIRKCPECKNRLHFSHFYSENHKSELYYLISVWLNLKLPKNVRYEILCCKCMKKKDLD